jgi:hypothetical protein
MKLKLHQPLTKQGPVKEILDPIQVRILSFINIIIASKKGK